MIDIHDLAAAALPLRDYFHKQGVRSLSIVGVVAPTTSNSIATLFALWSLGATTWLCPLREPAKKLEHMARHIGADFLLGTPTELVRGSLVDALQLIEDLKHAQAKTLINTSGSTGWPKFVEHQLSQHFDSARGVNEVMSFDATQSWLLSLPLYHVGGLAIVIRALEAGGSVVIPEPGESLDDVIRREAITHVSLVATQLRRLLANDEAAYNLKGYRRVILGGGPVPTWLSEDAKERALPLVASYGATEMASMWTAGNEGAGRLLPSRELKISPEGEVCVKGPMLFKRYVAADHINPFDDDGFYRTGDLGRVDDQGNLHILGRRDNMFISGGENIHPQEVELALLNHPLVDEAVVVGIPDVKWGERPVAFVRLVDANPFLEGDLKEYLSLTLPSFKIPDRFFEWPREELGRLKPSRTTLRQVAESLI
jgi:O-succinylbenzoic acid--CoA ligase